MSVLENLLLKVDTACWCWAVQQNSKRKGQVDWKSAFNELCEAWQEYQLKANQNVAILSSHPKTAEK